MNETGEKIRTLIVDDEPLARQTLRLLLERDPEIEIAAECGDGFAALEALEQLAPDLIFLDVQMPELGGFEVVEEFGVERLPTVVFVTAYDQYALRAFEAGALDYLLKPFDNARFERALNRAKERIARDKSSPKNTDRIAIKSAGLVSFVRIAEIDWIEAADYYSCLHVGARTHMLRRSMAEFERELDREVFCRTHRSTIVNLDRVRKIGHRPAGLGRELRAVLRIAQRADDLVNQHGRPPCLS